MDWLTQPAVKNLTRFYIDTPAQPQEHNVLNNMASMNLTLQARPTNHKKYSTKSVYYCSERRLQTIKGRKQFANDQ